MGDAEDLGHIEYLEVHNFKSYKGTHQIGPFKNFTAIIGPNGAGKSNVMDAISFVLGVDTKTLRGDSLGDLVHDDPGSDKKKMVCYVRMVFTKGDRQLEFKRSIVPKPEYATGWGTVYEHDGKKTKEAYEVGLGRLNIQVQKPNYLVFQKQVESIARKSPKELTALFEHISGSGELRHDYEMHTKERETANENALYLEKKRKGLKAELKEFKDQKKEADAHRQFAADLAGHKRRHLLFQLFYLNADMEKLAEELEAKKLEVANVGARMTESEKKVPALRAKFAAAQKGLQAMETELAAEERGLEQAIPELHVKQNQVTHLKRKLQQTQVELEDAKTKLATAQAKRTQLNAELEQLGKEEEKFKKANEEAMSLTGKKLTDQQNRAFAELKEKAREKSAAARSALVVAEREQESDTAILEEVHKPRANDLRDKVRIYEEQELPMAERRLKTLDDACQAMQTEKTTLEAERDEIQATNEVHSAEKAKAEAELQEIQEELKRMRVDTVEQERHSKMEECLQTMKRLFPGVHGRISELMEPTQERYKVAVTVALGANFDSIVVADSATAMECIQYMKEQRIGVATFIPLDSIRPNTRYDEMRTLEVGVIRPIIDVLKYDATFQAAMEYVCGNTLVCADLDKAREWAFSRGERRKVVTFEGILISKSGFMTGGVAGVEARARKWDIKKIQEKQVKRDELVTKITELNAQMRNVSRERELQSLIATLSARLTATGVDLDTCRATVKRLRKEIEDAKASLKKAEGAMALSEKAIAARAPHIAASKAEIAKVEDAFYGPFAQKVGIPNLREWEETRKSGLKALAEKGLVFKTQRARIQNLLAYAQQQDDPSEVQRLEKAVTDNEAQQAQLEEEIEAEKERLESVKATISGVREDFQAKRAESDTHEKALKEAVRNLDSQKALKTALGKAADAKETAIEQLKAKRHQLYSSARSDDIKLPLRGTKAFLDLSTIDEEEAGAEAGEEEGEKMDVDEPVLKHTQSLTTQDIEKRNEREDAIDLDFSSLEKEFRECKTQAQREEKLSAIVADIQSVSAKLELISPNYKATERLEQVQSTLDDLEKEITSAHKTADHHRRLFVELLRRRTAIFNDTFEEINNNINQVYKELTGGFGQATLDHSPEDPFLHPVNFTLSPKGKAFTDIQHLSGGEQSVAALALLFAIQKRSKTPFFVLDEIDAALDSDNVTTVAQYFHTKSSDVQFIVISLKDKCFEKADALVGVYQDRQGQTSKHLTLDLNAMFGEYHVE